MTSTGRYLASKFSKILLLHFRPSNANSLRVRYEYMPLGKGTLLCVQGNIYRFSKLSLFQEELVWLD